MRFRAVIRTVAAMFLLLGAAASGQAKVIDGGYIMDVGMPENYCAITFDDGPSRNTAELLDLLSGYGIPATFFVLGNRVEMFPHLVQRMIDEGHEVGNHSYSHLNLRKAKAAAKHEQITRTHELLLNLGVTPRYLRPPYGAYDNLTEEIASKLDLSILLWSLDSRDWKAPATDYAKLYTTRGSVLGDGELRGIFLFHDTYRNTLENLPRIIANLRAGGCRRFVTVSEYLEGVLDTDLPPMMTQRRKNPVQGKALPPQASGQTQASDIQPAALQVEGNASTPDRQNRQDSKEMSQFHPVFWPAGRTPVPMARCSSPWEPSIRDGLSSHISR